MTSLEIALIIASHRRDYTVGAGITEEEYANFGAYGRGEVDACYELTRTIARDFADRLANIYQPFHREAFLLSCGLNATDVAKA